MKKTGTSGLANKTDRELFGTRKVYKTVEKRESKKFKRRRSGNLEILNQTIPPDNEYLESENYGRKFKRQYRRVIKKGIDPMILLQDRDHYVCVEESVKGVSKISKPRISAP